MPLTPSETRKVLNLLGHRPKKKLGQNFLIDGNIVQKSIDLSNLEAPSEVLEIGPGLGTLTEGLLKQGHRVHAVEVDKRLAGYLEEKFSDWIKNNLLTLTVADAVKFPTGPFMESGRDFEVVANLPYAISSNWLEGVLGGKNLPQRMTLMLQKEASDRMWSSPGSKNYNALSIFLSATFELISSHPVSRNCFYPVPAIDSVLIHMKKVNQPFLFSERSRHLIRKIFTKRRKQMGKIIKQEVDSVQESLNQWIKEANLCTSLRPEEIEAEKWKKLADLI